MNLNILKKLTAGFSGVAICSTLSSLLLADGYVAKGSMHPDDKSGLIFPAKGLGAFGYISQTQATVLSLLHYIVSFAVILCALCAFTCSMFPSPGKLLDTKGNKIIFFGSALGFLIFTLFFGGSITDIFLANDYLACTETKLNFVCP